MIVEFLMREQYGHVRFFGCNKNAKTVLELMNRKTMNSDEILVCEAAGWDVVLSHPEIKKNTKKDE